VTDPVAVALSVAEVLEACGLRYLVGGSLASSLQDRGTNAPTSGRWRRAVRDAHGQASLPRRETSWGLWLHSGPDGRFLINTELPGDVAPITLIQHWTPAAKP